MIKFEQPALLLAPMEGVTNAAFRELIYQTGSYDLFFTEFIRVSEHVLPTKYFLKHLPELKTRTTYVQLLGGNPERLAQTALNAIEAGAAGIDLNFGCPAPTVNRHDGGATLLKYPERIEAIVSAVRKIVPAQFPVSAKMRLGFDDPTAIDENAKRAEQGGANWLTIHGRTKTQGYIPPAYWEPIGRINSKLSIPVVANGEIWTLNDFKRCQEITGCEHFMIGRASMSYPGLALEIRKALGISLATTPSLHAPMTLLPSEWSEWFLKFFEISKHHGQPDAGFEKKIKQWARYLNQKQPIYWWDEIKTLRSTEEILSHLNRSQPGPIEKQNLSFLH